MSRVRIPATKRVQHFFRLLRHSVEHRADKKATLSARPGDIRLHATVTKHPDGGRGATPVLMENFTVPGFTEHTFSVDLSSKMVERADEIARKSHVLIFETCEGQITVTGDDTVKRTEPASDALPPARPPWEDDIDSAEYDSARIGQVLESMVPVMGVVPGEINSLALSVTPKALRVTAGCATRRGSNAVKARNGSCQEIQALCPLYFARPLADFLKRIGGRVDIQAEGNQLRIQGKDFHLTLYRYVPFAVDAIAKESSTAIYRLTSAQVRQVQALVKAASTHEGNPVIELSREKDSLRLRYDSADTSDRAILVADIEVQSALGHSGIVRVPGNDLNRALESAGKQQSKLSGVYSHINDSRSLQLRLNDPHYLLELSQIELKQFPLHDEVHVFAAISTNYRLPGKSNLNGFLLSFFHFTKSVKDHPERFPDFLEKYGLLGLRLFCDCGAFTAKAKNLSIDPDQYAAFIEVAYRYFDKYTSLDHYYAPVDATVIEYVKLWGLGLSPIYVSHAGESLEELRRVLHGERGFKPMNVGWGGAARDGAGVRIEYVHQMLKLIPPEQLLDMQIHGFGMLQESLVKRFPFTSVDASTFGTWAEHYQIPTPWGLKSLKRRERNSVYSSSLYQDIVEWVKSLSYQQPIEMNFTLEELAEDLEMRQLFGLSYYAYLGKWFRHMDHMVRLQKFIPLDELNDMDEFIMPETRSVPQPAIEDLTPIKLITKHQNS